MSGYQPPLPFFGTPFVPPPLPAHFVQSPRNSPHPWRNYSPFRNNIANNVGNVGPLPLPVTVSQFWYLHFIAFLYVDSHIRATDMRPMLHHTIQVASRPS